MRWIAALAAWVALAAPTRAGVCEGCANPLVEVRPIEFAGEVPESLRRYLESGGGFERAWAWLDFQQRNPCADLQFLMDPVWKAPQLMGPHGKAEYWVESIMHFSGGGGRTLVRRQSGWDGERYQADGPALVPVIGRVTVRHVLRALRNGQIYDAAETQYAWVGDPPEGEFYARHDGPAVIGGETVQPADGLFFGDVSPRTAIEERIEFPRGDVGLTIRKKETPSAATLEVDDTSAYPPRYLVTVTAIQNELGEPMPDGIPVALRADLGRMEGGTPLDGWSVFTTSGGGLAPPNRYLPPRCAAKAGRATIELGDVCHWSELGWIVRRARAHQSAELPVCGTIKGTITYQRQLHWKGEAASEFSAVKETHDLSEDATLFVTATFLRKVKEEGRTIDYYEAKPLTGRFRYDLRKVTLATDKKDGSWTQIETTCQDGGWMEPGRSLLVTIDPKAGRYTLSAQVIFPSKADTTVFTNSKGGRQTSSSGDWAINGSLDVEGPTDGTSVKGNWSKPGSGPVLNSGGMVLGATWNWQLSRVGSR